MHDLTIVGGGLAGLCLAIALAPLKLNIALINERLPRNDDPRLLALNLSSCQLLKNLGVWNALSAQAAPIHQVHVSHQGRFGALRFQAKETGLPVLGYVIPAYVIETALNKALKETDINLYQPATLKKLEITSDRANLYLNQDQNEMFLQSTLVVGADGNESTVRKQLNMDTVRYDYQQSAIVTRTQLKRSHHHIAYERFHAQGIVAMLPLIDNECATIWTADNAIIDELLLLKEELFLKRLQNVIGYRLGRLEGIGKRFTYPLQMIQAKNPMEKCVFLLGNSAHTLHPVAAQGLNLALYEVAVLVECLSEQVQKQQPLKKTVLEEVCKRIQSRQKTSLLLSHQLALFSRQSSKVWLSIGSQCAMLLLDGMLPIKHQFIQQMLGRAGKTPPLLLSMNE